MKETFFVFESCPDENFFLKNVAASPTIVCNFFRKVKRALGNFVTNHDRVNFLTQKRRQIKHGNSTSEPS